MPRFAAALCAIILPLAVLAEPPTIDQYGDALPPGAIARLGTARWRVGGGANVMRFRTDGTLLTLSDNLVLQVWDQNSGTELRHFDIRTQVPEAPTSLRWLAMTTRFRTAVAPSDDGNTLA